ncbi:hypothetical protein GV729_23020 [Pseudomonas sp. Fl4BN2]|jgi:hypothetical protein|nr:hypothetical protein [Pseudomonas sp. Fl4BN2]
MNKTNKFSPEVRERAVRMVQEQRPDLRLNGDEPPAQPRVRPGSRSSSRTKGLPKLPRTLDLIAVQVDRGGRD